MDRQASRQVGKQVGGQARTHACQGRAACLAGARRVPAFAACEKMASRADAGGAAGSFGAKYPTSITPSISPENKNST